MSAATGNNGGGIAYEAGRLRTTQRMGAGFGKTSAQGARGPASQAGHVRTGTGLVASLLAGNQSLADDFVEQDVPQSERLARRSDRFSSERVVDEFDF